MVKTVIFPQFLFLFQALPIDIPLKSLRIWQKGLLDFIWSKSSRRISSLQLYKPGIKGGFGLPNLMLYYNAAQLCKVVTYLSEPVASGWLTIEAALVAPFNLKEIVWNQHKNRLKFNPTNPYVGLTLRIWDRNRGLLTSSPSFVSSFTGQSWFPSAASPSDFKVWRSKEMTRFCNVATTRGLLSKVALEEKHGILLSWFQYHQVSDLYRNYYLKYKTDRDLTGFEQILYKPLPGVCGLIATIYKDLGRKMWDSPASFQKAWDKDCKPEDSESRWNKVWSSFLYKSKSQYIRLQRYKMLSRWYMTPVWLYHMKVKIDVLCWKGCGSRGDFSIAGGPALLRKNSGKP